MSTLRKELDVTDILAELERFERRIEIPRVIRETEDTRDQGNLYQSPLQRYLREPVPTWRYEDGSTLVENPDDKTRHLVTSAGAPLLPAFSDIANDAFRQNAIPADWRFIGQGKHGSLSARAYGADIQGRQLAVKVSTNMALRTREEMSIVRGFRSEVERTNRSVLDTLPMMKKLAAHGIRTPVFYGMSHRLSAGETDVQELQFWEYLDGPTPEEIFAFTAERLGVELHKQAPAPHRNQILKLIQTVFHGDELAFFRLFQRSAERFAWRVRRDIDPTIGDLGNDGMHSSNIILQGFDEHLGDLSYAVVDLSIDTTQGFRRPNPYEEPDL